MYGVQQQPRPLKPGTVTTVEVIMAIKAALLLWATGQLCLGLVITVFDMDSSSRGIEVWMIAMLVIAAPAAALFLAVALRIAKGREWARVTAIVLESLALAGAPVAILNQHDLTVVVVLSMAASIAVICCATHQTASGYCRAN